MGLWIDDESDGPEEWTPAEHAEVYSCSVLKNCHATPCHLVLPICQPNWTSQATAVLLPSCQFPNPKNGTWDMGHSPSPSSLPS